LLLFFAILPEINTPWVTYGLPLAMIVCFLLALASAGGGIFSKRSVSGWREVGMRQRKFAYFRLIKKSFRDYVSYLIEAEFKILA
jgi:hypothetical protein